MRIAVVFQNVWTTASDPYFAVGVTQADADAIFNEVQNEWQNNRTNVARDVVHLFSAKNFTAGVSQLRGAHGQNVICNDPGRSYGFTADGPYIVSNTTAHEIGHGFDGRHPNQDGDPEQNQCGTATASVMCQGDKQFPPYFSQQQLQNITNHINNNQNCLLDFFVNINGPTALCSSTTYQAVGGPVNGNWTWSTSPNISLNTTNGQTVTATPTGNGIGWIEITQTVGCPITFRRNLTTGPPQVGYIAVNGQPTSNATVCVNNFASVEALPFDANSSYNWSLSNPGNAYLTNYGSANTSFNAYVADCYGLTLQVANSCGTTQANLTICAQNCFARYMVYPNPAKDHITIEFDNVDNADALPDDITLLSENSTKPLKTVNVQEALSRKAFKNGNQIEIDVRDLPRGTYYLHINNSRRKDKTVDAIRMLLE